MNAIGYLRVSTDKQDLDNQRNAINQSAAHEGIKLQRFIEEQISSRKADRKIYQVVEDLQPGEMLIVYELSRLARSIGEVFAITQAIKDKGASLWILEPELRIGLGNDLQADMLLFALSVASQIERNLISERTKSALQARREKGMKLGRPKGQGVKAALAIKEKSLDESQLIDWYKKGAITAKGISNLIGVNERTVSAWLKVVC